MQVLVLISTEHTTLVTLNFVGLFSLPSSWVPAECMGFIYSIHLTFLYLPSVSRRVPSLKPSVLNF